MPEGLSSLVMILAIEYLLPPLKVYLKETLSVINAGELWSGTSISSSAARAVLDLRGPVFKVGAIKCGAGLSTITADKLLSLGHDGLHALRLHVDVTF